jgi:hypothetical protein
MKIMYEEEEEEDRYLAKQKRDKCQNATNAKTRRLLQNAMQKRDNLPITNLLL